MSLTFSIAAPQSLTLPDGQTVQFCVNPADSSLVELHIVVDGGTHVLTFKRNGGAHDTAFFPAEKPKLAEDIPGTPVPVPPVPYADAPSVDKDAVRSDDWQTKQPDRSPQDARPPRGYQTTSLDPKPAA